MDPKKLRYPLFCALWFVVVPLALAGLTVWALKTPEPSLAGGAFGRVRWLVQDQPVPALIVFFTLFEMLVWNFRHSLPWAAEVGIGGRPDLPRELRREYEQAAQLVDEAGRILSQHRRQVEREIPESAREELSDSLAVLRETLEREPFHAEDFSAALDKANHLTTRHLARWRKGELREYVESIGIAVAVALLLRVFVVEAFKIPSGSMLPTLQIQDHIFVNKFAYGPTVPYTSQRIFSRMPPGRGDVMVFEYPDPKPLNPRQDFIKRVIALPGDRLEAEGGHPILNGWPVPSCRVGDYEYREGDDPTPKHGDLFIEFLGEYSYLTLYEDDHFDGRQGPYLVAPGEVWVMGDNRNNSSDSRAWNGGRGGGVPFANIKGRAMFVWLSFGVDGEVTWDRLLHNVLGPPVLPKGAPPVVLQGIKTCLDKRPATTVPPPPKPE